MGRCPAHLPLRVYLNSRRVGTLSREASGAIGFSYHEDWLGWGSALLVSLSLHSTYLRDVGGATLADILGLAQFDALHSYAKTDAELLNSWARGEGQEDLGPVEMLLFLTTWHRRTSLPNVSEHPQMSLGARRDYHAFLTTPIIRQALRVVMQEYDQMAPVLARPVRSGLHALAQGSLL